MKHFINQQYSPIDAVAAGPIMQFHFKLPTSIQREANLMLGQRALPCQQRKVKVSVSYEC
ncbi:MAG: hypothetical protein WBG74_01415 [Shewanella sp.]|uniref:hypothetical protein n=1 Tax=Shewanella sp. TaxID=50422 RepID=UPI003C734550